MARRGEGGAAAITTCWIVSCFNYGRSAFFCPHGEEDEVGPRGQQGSEGGCYR